MRWRSLVAACAVIGTVAVPARAQLASQTDRTEALALFRTGQEYLSAEQFERAAQAFGRAVQKDRLLSIAHYGIGQANMNLRRYASAIKAYADCIEAMRSLHDIEQKDRFEVDKQREDEIRELRTTLDGHIKGISAPTRLALEQHQRDLEDQRHSTGGVFRPPAEVLLALGSAYFRNGETEGAEANWKAAIEVNPKYGEAHNNLAVIYMQTGRLTDAARELRLAEKNGFRINPQFRTDLEERLKTSRRQ